MSARPHLFGMRPEDLVAHMEAVGQPIPLRRARQALAGVISEGGDLPVRIGKGRVAAIRANTRQDRLEIVERVQDPVDGSVRYLFRAPDGAVFEAVRIPLEKADRFSVCLSSQVGCAMRCDFCATGRLGLSRHLQPWEMVGAWLAVRDEAPGRVTGAVFMGQGEPFHNYDAVIRAAQVLSEPCGGRISGKAITISTVGLVPQIHRYAAEGHKFRLIVSLTSSVAARREALLPVAAKWSLEELAEALEAYHRASGRRVTVAWVLIGGLNHGDEEAEALAALLADVPFRINLIDVNDARDPAVAYRRATDDERNAFMDRLSALSVPMVRRYSVGAEQNSACGMLAAKRQQ